MRKLVIVITGALLAAIAVVTIAGAYPPATLTSTPNSITVDGLDCATNYEIRVREFRSGAWRDQNTYQKATQACPTPTPTATPTATPTVTPTATPTPTGFPDASTTGVPAGTTLTRPSLDGDGNLVVATNNAVVNGVDLVTGNSGEGGILVQATGVTIKNSKVRFVDTDFNAPNADGGAHPTVVQDTEIDCQQAAGSGIATAVYYGNYTLTRVNVHGCENGLDMGAGHVTVQDSYFHDLYMCPTRDCLPENTAPHTGVVQGDPGNYSTLRHNTMTAINLADCSPYNASDPFSGYGDGHCNGSGVIGWANVGTSLVHDVLIQNNLLTGAGTTIRCPDGTRSTRFSVTGNLMHPEYNSTGLSDDCADEDAHDNHDATTGALLNLT